MTESQKAFKESKGWIRLSVCVNVHIKKALLGILHNHINHPGVGIPSDPEKLYSFLLKNQNKLKQSRFLNKDQRLALLPQNKYVDTSKFDITLVRFLIQTFCGIKNAQRNWKEPDDSDQTIAAFVYRAGAMRNNIFHCNNIQAEETFEQLWSQIKDVLKGLKYDGDIESMKTEDLDYERCHQVLKEEFLFHLEDYKKKCANEGFNDNYIKRLFYDVKKGTYTRELKSILENNDGIIIYAEAGMGKSECARYIKHKWSKDELLNGYKMIYFNSKLINQHLEIQSNAAPIWFSEMGTHLKKNGKIIDEFAKYNCVQANMNKLFVVIDGIDEFPIKGLVKDDYLQILEKKILNNDAISAIDTIVGIYFGFFFPNSKLCLLGRTCEFERLNKFKDQQCSSVFDKKNRKDLKLVEFNNEDVNQFTCHEVCKNKCEGSCHEISIKVKKCELCRVPADLNSLIQMYQKSPEKDIGIITRTKLFISTLFNRLNEHTRQKNETEKTTFQELLENSSSCKLFECIRVISEISFSCFRNENVTINVKEELKDGISYFKFNGIYNDDIYIEREMLEQLDFFYIKNLNYSNYILEPYHLTKMEFLAACFIFSHDKELLFRLKGERFIAVLPYMAGLHAMDNFTHDFVTCVLNVREYQIDQFFDWLYGIENIRNTLPNGGASWYGFQDNQRLTPSIHLLKSIHREHKIPDTFIPKTIVNYSRGSFEWAQLHSLKDIFLGNEKKSNDIKFLIKGFLRFDNDKEMQNMNSALKDKQMTFKVNVINVRIDNFIDSDRYLKMFNFHLRSNSLRIVSNKWSSIYIPTTLPAKTVETSTSLMKARSLTTVSENRRTKIMREASSSLMKARSLTTVSENRQTKIMGEISPSLIKVQHLTTVSDNFRTTIKGDTSPRMMRTQPLLAASDNYNIKMKGETSSSLMRTQPLTTASETSRTKIIGETSLDLEKTRPLTSALENSRIEMRRDDSPSLLKMRPLATSSDNHRIQINVESPLDLMETRPLTSVSETSCAKIIEDPPLDLVKHQPLDTTSENFRIKINVQSQLDLIRTEPLTTASDNSRKEIKRETSSKMMRTRPLLAASDNYNIKMKGETSSSLMRTQPLTSVSETSRTKIIGESPLDLVKPQPLATTSENFRIKINIQSQLDLIRTEPLTTASDNYNIKMKGETSSSLMRTQPLTTASENYRISIKEETSSRMMRTQPLTSASETSCAKIIEDPPLDLVKHQPLDTTSENFRIKINVQSQLDLIRTEPLTTASDNSRKEIKRETSSKMMRTQPLLAASDNYNIKMKGETSSSLMRTQPLTSASETSRTKIIGESPLDLLKMQPLATTSENFRIKINVVSPLDLMRTKPLTTASDNSRKEIRRETSSRMMRTQPLTTVSETSRTKMIGETSLDLMETRPLTSASENSRKKMKGENSLTLLKMQPLATTSENFRIKINVVSPLDLMRTKPLTTASDNSRKEIRRETSSRMMRTQPLTTASETSRTKMIGETSLDLMETRPLTSASENSSKKMKGENSPSLLKMRPLTIISLFSCVKMKEKTLQRSIKNKSLTKAFENSCLKKKGKTSSSLMKVRPLTTSSLFSCFRMKRETSRSLIKTQPSSTSLEKSCIKKKGEASASPSLKTQPLISVSENSRNKSNGEPSQSLMKTKPLTTSLEKSCNKKKGETSTSPLLKTQHLTSVSENSRNKIKGEPSVRSLKVRPLTTSLENYRMKRKSTLRWKKAKRFANFKQIMINDIEEFRGRRFLEFYSYCVYKVDLLSLSYTFFSEEQLSIVDRLEKKHGQVCLQLHHIEFKNVFKLPSLCTRQISIRNTKFVNNEDLIKLKKEIEKGSKKLPRYPIIDNYKIIKSTVPFIRKNIFLINHDKVFHLHLHRVNFSNTSPEQFALTMCSIPSLEISDDNGSLIPYSHWENLSQVKCLYTNELRVWLQYERTRKITNLGHFLSIKLHRLQLICGKKEDLKYVLNFMKERPLMTEKRFIKVFIVRVDFDDWNNYDEKVLFSGIPIKTFFDDYLENLSLLDDKEYESYFEGELQFKHWCCELLKDDTLSMQLVDGARSKIGSYSYIFTE